MYTRFAPAALLALTLATGAFGQQPEAIAPSMPPALYATAPNIEPSDSPIWDGCGGNCAGPVCGPPGRIWANFDALGWWIKGASLPPLVTSSPAGTARGQAGVIGAPGTTVVFGNSRINNDLRFGGRVNLGFWLDPEQTIGFQTSFFGLEGLGNTFHTSSGGSPILARPFTDVTTGQPASELVAFPGVIAGSVTANPTSSSLWGANALFRENICCGCSYRLDALGGYRYLHFGDGIGLSENLINSSNAGLVPVGTNLVVNDSFQANNNFNGFDFGFVGQTWRGRWMLQGMAQLAVGRTGQTLQINGNTTITVPGQAPVSNPGGLLALGSNIGTFHDNTWTVIPEFGGQIGYRINRNVYAFVGYTFLYWSDVVRAGSQIDLGVNPNLIPPVTASPNGPLRPAPLLHGSDLWAQGVNLGIQFRF